MKLEDTEELYFPKCFCILTKYPFHSFMRCLVKEIYRAVSERKSYSNRLIAFALRSCKQHFFFLLHTRLTQLIYYYYYFF